MVMHVGGDVLALGAVAARGRLHQAAVLVGERDREAVDLGLGRQLDGRVGGEAQEAAHAGDEVDHVLVAEGVAEREHRHGVAHLAEGLDGRGADALARGCRRAPARESAPRSPHCAGAARRSRRRRSRARPARSRGRRGARSRAPAARARPSPRASVSLSTGLLDCSLSPSCARDCLRAAREIQTPSGGLPAATRALLVALGEAQRRLARARSRPARRSARAAPAYPRAWAGPAMAPARAGLGLLLLRPPGVSALMALLSQVPWVDLRAQAAGLQQRVGVLVPLASSDSCARARRRPPGPRARCRAPCWSRPGGRAPPRPAAWSGTR